MSASASLLARLEAAAERPTGITFLDASGDGPHTTERIGWGQLHDEARAMAAALATRGVGPGTTVAMLGTTSRPLVTAVQATWLTGATLVMLPLPMRLASLDEFVAQTRTRIGHADAALVAVDPELAPFAPPGDVPTLPLDELARDAERRRADEYDRPSDDPDALAILQFTSGSTAAPKGVLLPHRCITANLDAMLAAARVDLDTDRCASWLPLYHDMGLIGLLGVPMLTGFDLVLAPTQDFLASPALWVEMISEFGCTVTGGPNFAYALAHRALRRLDGLDLSRWRIALNGAEPIDPAAVEAFLDAGARHGLDPRSAFCVYGMAEATLAISFPEPGRGMEVDSVDRRVLETDGYAAPTDPDAAGSRRLALLGRPLPGVRVRVVDPTSGEQLRDREAGELEVRGESITPGYLGNPTATAEAFREGWLRTGDLGYLVEGQVVVCGRLKDVIIVGGRNVFPEDIERAAAAVEGLRPGNVIAFGTEGRRGREAIVVVAETKADDSAPVRDAVATRVTEAVGVPPSEVVLVRPGSLPKTSSGKLQRSLCRTRYLSEVLEPA